MNRSVIEFLEGLEENDQDELGMVENIDAEVEDLDEADSEAYAVSLKNRSGANHIESLIGPSVSIPSYYKYSSFAAPRKEPSRTSLQFVMAFNDMRRADPPSRRNRNYQTLSSVNKVTNESNDELIDRMRRKSTIREQVKQKKLKIRLQDELQYDKLIHERNKLGLNTIEVTNNRYPAPKVMQNNLIGGEYDKSFVEDLPNDSSPKNVSLSAKGRSSSFS